MNSIENYKKRFNMLMESTLGDVRPLIMEAPTNTEGTVQQVMNQVAGILNAQIDAKIKENPQFPQTKLTVQRVAAGDRVLYKFMYGNQQVGEGQDISIMLTQGGAKLIGNSVIQTFNINYNKTLPKTLQQLPQPGLQNAVNTWVAQFSPTQPQAKTPTKPGTQPQVKTPTQPK